MVKSFRQETIFLIFGSREGKVQNMLNFGYFAMLSHGETYDEFGRPRPSNKASLSKDGLRDARKIATWLRKEGITGTRFIASPGVSSLQTAAIIIPKAKWRLDDRFGGLEGDIVRGIPVLMFEAANRVRSAIEALDESTLVVTHRHLMRAIDLIIMRGLSTLEIEALLRPRRRIPEIPFGAFLEYKQKGGVLRRRLSYPLKSKTGKWRIVEPRLYTSKELMAFATAVIARESAIDRSALKQAQAAMAPKEAGLKNGEQLKHEVVAPKPVLRKVTKRRVGRIEVRSNDQRMAVAA